MRQHLARRDAPPPAGRASDIFHAAGVRSPRSVF